MPPQKKHFIFWQNILSFHQSAHIRALAAMPECEVTLVVQESLPKSFQKSGWTTPDFGNARIVIPSNDLVIDKLVLTAGKDAVHIFSGIRFPMVKKAFLKVLKKKARIGLLSEASDWRGIKGLARLFWYKIQFMNYRNKIDFVLAIGHLGIRWYLKCGFPARKIFPYGYFVENPNQPNLQSSFGYDNFRLIFVGQCIKRKGIDILLAALSGIHNKKWHLDIVGDGIDLENLKKNALKLKLIDNVTFHGAKSNKETLEAIAKADLLVLPSRWDGWGAVVNEALMQGVPVICSDMCGAADLLGDSYRGEHFKSENVQELRAILSHRISTGKLNQATSSSIKYWAQNIKGEIVAYYFLNVLKSINDYKPKPVPPWL